MRSSLVSTPMVRSPCGSTSRAICRPSELATSWFAAVTASTMQLGREMTSRTMLRICCRGQSVSNERAGGKRPMLRICAMSSEGRTVHKPRADPSSSSSEPSPREDHVAAEMTQEPDTSRVPCPPSPDCRPACEYANMSRLTRWKGGGGLLHLGDVGGLVADGDLRQPRQVHEREVHHVRRVHAQDDGVGAHPFVATCNFVGFHLNSLPHLIEREDLFIDMTEHRIVLLDGFVY
mmetsp:Transcript_16669/g.45385  ORF Transcript_16669/g.45385 Transcript_16669/m.45385 type:complete len:234 (-) Transcript_16669:259-960(-)